MTDTTPTPLDPLPLLDALLTALPGLSWGLLTAGVGCAGSAQLGGRNLLTSVVYKGLYQGIAVWFQALTIDRCPPFSGEFLGWDGDPPRIAASAKYHIWKACEVMERQAEAIYQDAVTIRTIVHQTGYPPCCL